MRHFRIHSRECSDRIIWIPIGESIINAVMFLLFFKIALKTLLLHQLKKPSLYLENSNMFCRLVKNEHFCYIAYFQHHAPLSPSLLPLMRLTM